MAIGKAITGNVRKNKGCTIVKAGNVATADLNVNDFSVLELASGPVYYGSKVVLATGETGSSGNVGTGKCFSNGAFNYQGKRVIMARRLTTTINNTANTVLYSGASHFGNKRGTNSLTTTRRLNETGWNAVTGAVTKGADAGASVDFGADHAVLYSTNAVPGEIVYRTGAPMPYQDNLKPRYNP